VAAKAELPRCDHQAHDDATLGECGHRGRRPRTATTFFVELGLKVLGEGPVEGGWVDRVVGLEGVRVDIAMLERAADTLGIRRVAFAVHDIDAAVARLQARGTELVGGVERFEDSYRLCYVRGPEGIIVMLAEQIG
jgi:catechol 2,3-dioxygenase-like lactoylglutathione lyase family enzyme